jgi:hypothetical protein
MSDHDAQLKKLLVELLSLIEVHGPRGDVVREFVRRNDTVPEFVDLAAVCVFTAEQKSIVEHREIAVVEATSSQNRTR